MSVSGSVWSESVSDGNVGVISGEMCKPGSLDARETPSRCRMVNEEVLQFSTSKALSNATGDGLNVRQPREKDNINYGGVSEMRNLRIGLDFALSEFHIRTSRARTGDKCEGLFLLQDDDVVRYAIIWSAKLSCTDPMPDLGFPNASRSAWGTHFSLQYPLHLAHMAHESLILGHRAVPVASVGCTRHRRRNVHSGETD